jgi:hypothetical protein
METLARRAQRGSPRSSRESGFPRSPSHTTGRAGPHPAVHQDIWSL